MVSFSEFKKLKLVVADIIAVEEIPGKDKLYKLRVSTGSSEKQLVAGIKGLYSKQELKGKQIVLVENLDPANIAGTVSEGMLLAAVDGNSIALVVPDKRVSRGASVE